MFATKTEYAKIDSGCISVAQQAHVFFSAKPMSGFLQGLPSLLWAKPHESLHFTRSPQKKDSICETDSCFMKRNSVVARSA
jgi:hypothetical protein